MPPTSPFDLQAHSVHSDGECTPSEVVARAAAAGVELLALSDHDTVAGVDEALDAAQREGIALVTATELSSVDPSGEDLHVLGYGIDQHDETLLRRLKEFRADRGRRADRMAAALRELGYDLDEQVIEARRASGATIGRPHLAQAVVGAPANAARLEREGLTDPTKFLVEYLIEGAPAFRGREIPTVPQAIEAIHDAGGLAVWAHPFWDVKDPAEVLATIDRFVGWGLDGVEVFYVTHTREQVLLLDDRCAELGLLTTGSSDFHGPGHRLFSRFAAHECYGREPRLGAIAASR